MITGTCHLHWIITIDSTDGLIRGLDHYRLTFISGKAITFSQYDTAFKKQACFITIIQLNTLAAFLPQFIVQGQRKTCLRLRFMGETQHA